MKTNLFSLLAFVVVLFFSTGCEKQFICLRSDGTEVVRAIEVEDFTGIHLSGSGNVELSQGELAFEVEGPENLIENLDLSVKDQVLYIEHKTCVWKPGLLTYRISVPQLTYAGVSGSGDVVGTVPMVDLEKVELSVSGSGSLELELYAREVQSRISGSGSVTLQGEAEVLNSGVSGSGDVFAFEFPVKNCEIKVSGSGDHEVNVSESLNVEISGSGDVFYKGSPSINTSNSGSGKLVDSN